MSSDGENYLNSDDVNEEYSYGDEMSEGQVEEGNSDFEGYSEEEEEEEAEGETFESEQPKYSEELEYEDIGEPATFNFNIHNGEPVYSLDFLQGTEILATGSGDDRALIVDARGLEVLADLGTAGDSIISVKFYQGEAVKGTPLFLATASMDGLVRVYASNPKTGIDLKSTFEGPGEGIECYWIDWHPRGPILIAGYADGSIWMWNIAITNPLMRIFAGHVTTPATSGAFTPDGKFIVSGSEEGVLLVHSPKDDPSTPVAKIVPQSHQETSLGNVTNIAPHPDSQIFMAGDAQGHLRVYKTTAAFQSMPLNDLSAFHSASIESIGFHPIGSLAFSASMDGHAIIYDCHPSFNPRHNIQTCRLFHDTEQAPLETEGFTLAKWLAALPNGLALPPAFSFGLLLGTSQGRIAIVEARSGLQLRRFRGRPGRPVLDASVSSNGILAVAFDDGIISLYQL